MVIELVHNSKAKLNVSHLERKWKLQILNINYVKSDCIIKREIYRES